jgi:hypothetical protein
LCPCLCLCLCPYPWWWSSWSSWYPKIFYCLIHHCNQFLQFDNFNIYSTDTLFQRWFPAILNLVSVSLLFSYWLGKLFKRI